MHVCRIAVRHWRGLEDLALEDLAPGLNLVSGPNESGKSRLVQALWYALFESSRGRSEAKKDLQSHGIGSERPWVGVDFELAGERWRVEKQFLGTGTNTELRGPAGRLEGDAAEARLRELLRVARPSSRGLKKEDAGIWPLLWVEQHESARVPTAEAGNDARHRLLDGLTAEVGEVAAGELGNALLQRAREQRDRYYTPSQGSETGPLREARERLAVCEAALEKAREARDASAVDASRLDAARAEAAGFGERLEEAEARLREARGRCESARGAREKLAQVRREEEAARAAFEQAAQRVADRRSAAVQLAERAERVAQLEAERESADTRAMATAKAAAEGDAEVATAEARAETARVALEHLRQSERRHAAREALIVLRGRLGAARAIDTRIGEALEGLAELPTLTDDDLQSLSDLRDARAAARARLDGAAVRVTLEADYPLTVDGEVIEAGAARAWTIDDDRTLALEGVGRLRIEPGAGELAKLRDALRDVEGAESQRLRDLGVRDVNEARHARERRRDLERDLAAQRSALEREAPAGVDALAASVREQERRLDLDAGAAPPDLDGVDAHASDLAGREDTAARGALVDARARRDHAREQLQAVRAEIAGLDARRQAAREEHAAQVRHLEALASAEALEGALAQAAERLRAASEHGVEARKAFDALGGEAVEDDVERLEKSLSQLRDAHVRLGREISVLEDRLRAAGDEGRHETVQEREVETEQARAELARIERQARAARRLFEVLDTAAREARERLTGPVAERIGPYLAELFPGTGVWLDEAMNLQGLRSERADARFEELSGGAREQLALLVRIGLAEVLGADESWPLVLDDALVNTDPERIERLQRLLYHASKKMQILLFTCHGRLYDTLGADRRVELPAGGRAAAPR